MRPVSAVSALRPSSQRRGAALVLALLTAAMVLTLVLIVSAGASRASQSTSGAIEQQRALMTARAGVWAAANYLSQGGDEQLAAAGDEVGIDGLVDEARRARQETFDPTGGGERVPLADLDGDGRLDFSHHRAFEGRGGAFEARIRREASGQMHVLSRGGDGSTVRTVEAWLERDTSSSTPFRRAIFSELDLQLNSEVFTDSYDSLLVGPYSAHTRYQAFDDNGNPAQWAGAPVFLASVTGLPGAARGEVASNGAIQLKAGAFVFGDARPGPTRTVDLGGTGQNHVEGVTTPLSQPLLLKVPAWQLPTLPGNEEHGLPKAGAILDRSAQAVVVDARGKDAVELLLERASLKSGATLTFLGDPGQEIHLYLTDPDEGALELDSASALRIAPAGQQAGPRLVIHSAGGVNVNAGSALNPDGDPAQLQIYSQLDDPKKAIRLNSKVTSRAVIYAPRAGLEFNSQSEFFGAVVAGSVKFNSKILFHYDESLAGLIADPLPPPLYVPRVIREAR